jgi:hypothetical protein
MRSLDFLTLPIAADAVSYQLSNGGLVTEYTDTSPEQLPTKLSRIISAWDKLIKQQIKLYLMKLSNKKKSEFFGLCVTVDKL